MVLTWLSLTKLLLIGAAVGTATAGGVAVLRTSGPLTNGSGDAASVSEPVVSTIVGGGPVGPTAPEKVDGAGSAARLNQPGGLAIDAQGNIYVADFGNDAIRRIDPGGMVTTVAGGNGPGLRDGLALQAQFFGPNDVAVGPDGAIYVADTGNHRIRRITTDGRVDTVAGSGPSGMGQGGFADGPALEARFQLPKGIAIAADGTIYVADTDNSRIRVIALDGNVSTLAGSGMPGQLVDGKGAAAVFALPSSVALGPDGAVYVSDQPNSAIRRVALDGTVTTVLSTGLLYPFDVVAGPDGTLYVADTSNYRVVSIDARGRLVPVAGTGKPGGADGLGSAAEFRGPAGLLLVNGRLFVGDSENHRIRLIEGVR